MSSRSGQGRFLLLLLPLPFLFHTEPLASPAVAMAATLWQSMEAELREALATERRRLKKAMKKIDECKRQGAADTATERERRIDVEGMLVQSERKVRI